MIRAKDGAYTVRQIPCGKYDVRLVDEVGDECVMAEQNVCDSDLTWEFSSEKLLACQQRQREGVAAAQ